VAYNHDLLVQEFQRLLKLIKIEMELGHPTQTPRDHLGFSLSIVLFDYVIVISKDPYGI
jgi:hypothetical protein